MELADDVRAALFDAGAEAVRFNAPVDPERAPALVAGFRRLDPQSVVDLGCGRGEWVRLIAQELDTVTIVGVDTDHQAIEVARRRITNARLADRARFEVADAASWSGSADAAVCVGASHVFGGPAAMFARLAEVVPEGSALVGDSVWTAEPNPWCLDAFGELPNGADGLASMAVEAGWNVEQSGLSTSSDWDAFEGAWTDGVRSLATPIAEAFADEREWEYRNHYRGVLGFCWLTLGR